MTQKTSQITRRMRYSLSSLLPISLFGGWRELCVPRLTGGGEPRTALIGGEERREREIKPDTIALKFIPM